VGFAADRLRRGVKLIGLLLYLFPRVGRTGSIFFVASARNCPESMAKWPDWWPVAVAYRQSVGRILPG